MRYCILLFFTAIALHSTAQVFVLPGLQMPRQGIRPGFQLRGIPAQPSQDQLLLSKPEAYGPVKYSAFFCNLELKSLKSLGIMVKIHAGEYDRYFIGHGTSK
ncbi:MAG: hypothetical protein V4616_11490 [Bacteroidota bacterium]